MAFADNEKIRYVDRILSIGLRIDNSQWPGSSPDLNATENLGAILKKHVEDRILKIPSMERNSVETLKTIISEELIKIKEEPEIFANLLKSYPARLDAVRKNHGGHTDY